MKQRLEAAGYSVRNQYFSFPFFAELAPATLSQVSPTPTDYETSTLDYSGSGSVTGTVVPTRDVMVPPGATPSSSNSGCEDAGLRAGLGLGAAGRARPARHLHLRGEGHQRAGRPGTTE